MIVIQKRPYNYCMTGNPVMYELYSALATTNSNIYFEVKIRFCKANNVFFTDSITIPAYPVNGIARIDIKDILNALLTYDIPEFDVNEKLSTNATNQSGYFYIQYRELVPGITAPTFDDSESEYVKTIIKAGMNYFKYRGDNFWENYFNDANPFLTWQQSGRLASLTERMYLGFFLTMALPSWSIPEVVGPGLWQAMQVFYTDGTSSAVQYVEVAGNYQNAINFIPCGAEQWDLASLNPAKQIYYWKTRMEYTSASDGTKTALNDWFTFYADNRNDYNQITLNYRNSLGCMDSARVRGVIEKNLDYSFDQQDRTFLADYFSGDSITPARVIANSKENVIYKGDIGFLRKEEQERMRDMNLQRECWWEINEKWVPVMLLTPSLKMKSTEDNLWSMPIEFKLAADGDKFYTPDIDLGDRTFDTNVCSAEISDIVPTVDTSGPTGEVSIMFDYTLGLTQYSYQVIGVHADPIVANTGDLPLVITGLPLEAAYIIKLRPICTGGIIGRVFTASFNTIGDGGSGGGGTGTSSIINNTPFTQIVIVKVEGVEVFNLLMGSGGIEEFSVADTPGAQVRVILENAPVDGTLESDSVTYPYDVINSVEVRWNSVDIVGGMAIEVF